MATRKPAGATPARKKSVSNASAARGREDSRAIPIKREKNTRSIRRHESGRSLADHYEKRARDVDRQRKVTRREKHTAK